MLCEALRLVRALQRQLSMRALLLLPFILACGSERPPANHSDAGTKKDSGTPKDGGTEGCNLGIPSLGRVVDRVSEDQVLLEFEKDSTAVKIARHYVEWGIGESKIFRISGFALNRGNFELCVTDASQLNYVNSHHNW